MFLSRAAVHSQFGVSSSSPDIHLFFPYFSFLALAKAECDGYDVPSLLIMPVQRLPRYVLLLGEVLKNTPEFVRDRPTIQSALEAMRDVTESINDAKKHSENLARVLSIAEDVVGVFGAKKTREFRNFALPHRLLIASGSCEFFKSRPELFQSFDAGQDAPADEGARAHFDKMLSASKRKPARWYLFSDALFVTVPKFLSKPNSRRSAPELVLEILPLQTLQLRRYGEQPEAESGAVAKATSWVSKLVGYGQEKDDITLPETSQGDAAQPCDEVRATIFFGNRVLRLPLARDTNSFQVVAVGQTILVFSQRPKIVAALPFQFWSAADWESATWGQGGTSERDLWVMIVREHVKQQVKSPLTNMAIRLVDEEQAWLQREREKSQKGGKREKAQG
jgi:RhoGEF domain